MYSYDAWLKSTIPDYSFRTYYTKGALLGMLLDIDLRLQTNHKKSMDGFFKFLYYNVYKQGKTFDLQSYLQYLIEYSQLDFAEFFEKYITGTDELPINEYFERVGLKLQPEKELPFLQVHRYIQ